MHHACKDYLLSGEHTEFSASTIPTTTEVVQPTAASIRIDLILDLVCPTSRSRFWAACMSTRFRSQEIYYTDGYMYAV
eukprot:COSAG05_NODE_1344_length_5130_cov_5.136156_4_plen_78_part_00